MTDSRSAVRHALARLVVARPWERTARMQDLMTAGSSLRDETEALHDWLIRAWDWLDAHPHHERFVKREAKLLDEIQRYQTMHDLLGKALVAIGKEAR